jgi:opacity protein-like surface antigen
VLKKTLILLFLSFLVFPSHAEAAKRRYRPIKKKAPVVAPTVNPAAVTPSVTVTGNATPTATALVKPEEKKSDSKLLLALYGGYNTNGQLSEVGGSGNLNYVASGGFNAGLELGYITPSLEYVLGVNYTGQRQAMTISGLAAGGINPVSWSVFPVYLAIRKQITAPWYVTAGVSYSSLDVQGAAQINSLHSSTSFTVNGGFGFLLGVGYNLNRNVVFDMKYMLTRGNITFTGGPNSGNSFPLDVSGFVLSLGYRL